MLGLILSCQEVEDFQDSFFGFDIEIKNITDIPGLIIPPVDYSKISLAERQ